MNDDEKTPPALPGPTLRPASTPGPASVAVDLGSLAQPVRPEALDKGTNVRGWVIVDRLGAGGMGVVYLVKSESDANDVAALKLSVPLPDESPDAKAERETRFEREAATIVQLRHPNIIKGREFFRWQGSQGHPCLVMPYLTGETLLPYWRKATPSLRVSFRELFWPLADALGYIHAKNIFHRDIKPANIMVQAGHPLLVDFGIARSRAAHTMTGTDVLCTPEYTAPEHLLYANSLQRAEEEVYLYRPEADLFCFGATIFECLTGRLPYQHLPTSKAGFMDPRFQIALQEYEPLSASECNPAVPASVDQFLGRLMSRDPEARFQTGAEVAAAIDALLEQQDPAFDVPFVPPKRVAAGAAKSTATTADRRRPPTGPPKTPKPLTSAAPPSLVAPSLVAAPVAPKPTGQESFRPPTALGKAPKAFSDPVPQRAQEAAGEPEAPLPTGFRRAQQLLNASSPAAGGQRWLVGGLAAAIVVLVLVVAAVSSRPTQTNATSSLLDSTEKTGPQVAPSMPVAAPVLPAAASPQDFASVDAGGLAPPVVVTRSSVAKGKNTDSAEIDALLRNEYGGKRPVVEGELKPAAPVGPKKPSWLKVTNASQPAAEETGKRTFGVPMGTEIAVRLQKPLDSRTVSSGPVIARLMRPLVVRGGVVFSSGTMVYGTASATSAGRFDARFTRLKLADGTEIVFSGIAYDSDDKKPGIRATSRIQGGSGQSSGLGDALVKGAANTLLGKVPGGDAADVAKGAGQTVVNHDERSASGASGEALLLDAPADFTVFVAAAF
ncbi:MAG: protein kinase [Myxococcales bacterium]|nr:protein kinase [Myxococcales bacterium]